MFKNRRWRMGESNKISIALVFMCVPLGCAGSLQETHLIQCKDHGQILYTGPYNEESLKGYLVQVDDMTHAFYPKGMCHKVPA